MNNSNLTGKQEQTSKYELEGIVLAAGAGVLGTVGGGLWSAVIIQNLIQNPNEVLDYVRLTGGVTLTALSSLLAGTSIYTSTSVYNNFRKFRDMDKAFEEVFGIDSNRDIVRKELDDLKQKEIFWGFTTLLVGSVTLTTATSEALDVYQKTILATTGTIGTGFFAYASYFFNSHKRLLQNYMAKYPDPKEALGHYSEYYKNTTLAKTVSKLYDFFEKHKNNLKHRR